MISFNVIDEYQYFLPEGSASTALQTNMAVTSSRTGRLFVLDELCVDVCSALSVSHQVPDNIILVVTGSRVLKVCVACIRAGPLSLVLIHTVFKGQSNLTTPRLLPSQS